MSFNIIIDIICLSFIFMLIGLCGIFVVRKHLIQILISLELLLLSINLIWISFSIYHDDLLGQILSLVGLTVAASESALGLAILVSYYKIYGVLSLENLNLLKA